jgi:putative ABC transport system permease protein
MFRRKGRLLLTQVVLVGAGTMFLMVMSLSASIDYTLDTELNRRGFDIRLGFEDAQPKNRILGMLRSVAGVERAELWYVAPAALLKQGQRLKEAGVGAMVVGIPSDSDYYKPMIVKGRWFQPGDGRVLLISRDTADDNDIKVGDTVTLNLFDLGDAEWQVIGIFQVIFGGGFDATPIYAPIEAVAAATKQYNKGTRLLVSTTTHHPAAIAQQYSQIKNLFEDRQIDINVFDAGTTPQDRQDAISQFNVTTTMLLFLAIIVAIVGGIGLMGSLSISVVERTREIGVMRAIGASSRSIARLFIGEGLVLGLLSWLIALPLSLPAGYLMTQALGAALNGEIVYHYTPWGALYWLAIITVLSIAASWLPAQGAVRVSVRESLAYQ